jgi:hypothetical protein
MPEGTPDDAGNGGGKTFTQAELDTIIADRLKRQAAQLKSQDPSEDELDDAPRGEEATRRHRGDIEGRPRAGQRHHREAQDRACRCEVGEPRPHDEAARHDCQAGCHHRGRQGSVRRGEDGHVRQSRGRLPLPRHRTDRVRRRGQRDEHRRPHRGHCREELPSPRCPSFRWPRHGSRSTRDQHRSPGHES